MRSPLRLLLLAALPFALAYPAEQIPLGNVAHSRDPLQGATLQNYVDQFLTEPERLLVQGKQELDRWFHGGKEYIKQNGQLFELIQHPTLHNYRLRIKQPKLCDPSVKQYSGYLDIDDDKSLFFWYFDSRANPDSDPLVLWLNGGPGCSSSTGLLFELGPCNVANEGHNTTSNPFSWNSHANMIFLDQPVNVGFSYASDGTSVSTSAASGIDVHAFLQIFLQRFPTFKGRPFHVAAESYGGHYAPNIASVIFNQNKHLAPGLVHINLESVILANGLTDPYIQYGSIADYVCDGPYPVYGDPDGPQCSALRSKIPTCQRLVDSCNKFQSKLTCVPAILYCNSQLFGPLMQTGKNPYDVRLDCDRSKDGDLCYRQMGWIDTWMNTPANKVALGADPSRTFASCNMNVNRDFTMQGDGVKNSALLLPEMINKGVRLLVYAGNADMMCNYIGNERWVEALETDLKSEFSKSKPKPWYTLATQTRAGEVRSAGGGLLSAGNVTFVNVYEAGHMVPHDQPEAALDLITRWIKNVPLAF